MTSHHAVLSPQIIDEASDWFVLMREQAATRQQREAFAEWLAASPVHVRAYIEIARLWGDCAKISAELDVDLPATADEHVVRLHDFVAPFARHEVAAENAVDRADAADVPHDKGGQGVLRRVWWPSGRRYALAASLMIVCLSSFFALWLTAGGRGYTTDFGEQRLITLEDGSTVLLNSRSRLSVRLSDSRRHVDLLEGQALFQVARDPNRPFVVRSGVVSVQAVGTSFDVNRRQSGTVITVVEGKVRVESTEPSKVAPAPAATKSSEAASGAGPGVELGSQGNGLAALLLTAGQQVSIDPGGDIERDDAANIQAATSWTRQELAFSDAALATVLEEFQRFSRTPIVLNDASLLDLRINAVFHNTNPDSLLRFISQFEDVEVERTQKEIRIRRKR